MIAELGVKQILRWVGSKRKLADRIVTELQAMGRPIESYWEPCAGSAAVFLELYNRGFRPKTVLSDLNSALINCYKHTRDEPENVVQLLEVYRVTHQAVPAEHRKEHYREISRRPWANTLEDAARFLYVNQAGFNGLWRVNAHGTYNTPMGDSLKPFDEPNFYAFSAALQGVVLEVRDVTKPGQALKGRPSHVYIDPPYHKTFSQYTAQQFEDDQQGAVMRLARELSAVGASVLVSNADTEFVRSIYAGCTLHEVSRSGSMNSDPTKRQRVPELLIEV